MTWIRFRTLEIHTLHGFRVTSWHDHWSKLLISFLCWWFLFTIYWYLSIAEWHVYKRSCACMASTFVDYNTLVDQHDRIVTRRAIITSCASVRKRVKGVIYCWYPVLRHVYKRRLIIVGGCGFGLNSRLCSNFPGAWVKPLSFCSLPLFLAFRS
ncbi:hypothetical protein K439DRAFT_125950 [Ramaria rubella]|nr:hypothetical protein K439DRAFT_125950 [Ramaria rubella]